MHMFIYEQKVGYLNELRDMCSEKKIFHCIRVCIMQLSVAALLIYYWFISYIRMFAAVKAQ